MDDAKNVPLDESKLTQTSKKLLSEVLAWNPDFAKYCSMDEAPYGCDLRMLIPSPTGIPSLGIVVWFAGDEEDISVLFGGPWHCHESATFELSSGTFVEKSVFETLKMIVEGKVVSISEAPDFESTVDVIFPPDRPRITEILTAPGAPSAIKLRSWDGNVDQVFSLELLK